VSFRDAEAGAFHFAHGETEALTKRPEVRSGLEDGHFTFRNLHQYCHCLVSWCSSDSSQGFRLWLTTLRAEKPGQSSEQ